MKDFADSLEKLLATGADDCYLCGQPITAGPGQTADHVVPTLLIDREQPKALGYEYAGKLPTHSECNNHFKDENFFKQALHLVLLVQAGETHNALQSVQHPGIVILPVTPDQVPKFGTREFRRFNFIDTRTTDVDDLKKPAFYADKTKTNLQKVALHASMTVLAKSAAALLIKRKLVGIPARWRIFASPHELRDPNELFRELAEIKPFDTHTRAALHHVNRGEWRVIYQYKTLLVIFLFAFHDSFVDFGSVFVIPGSEVHEFSSASLKDLLAVQWQPAMTGGFPPN